MQPQAATRPWTTFVPYLAIALLLSSQARAQWKYDERQLPILPPYCKYTQAYREAVPGANDPAQIERWSSLLGRENFFHLHHYCWALEAINRAQYFERDKNLREGNLRASIGDVDYVLQRVKPDFVLLPEILTKKGETLIQLGRGPEAAVEFQRAIEKKPDYWPPYAALSDYLKSAGDVRSARKWLERGVAATGDAKPLQRRLDELKKGK